MSREHAATPRRNTEEDDRGKKQKAAQTHGGNKRQAGKAPPRSSPWPATPHQPSHTNTIAVLPVREREDSALHKREAHTASSHTQWTRRRSDPPPSPPPVQSHGQRDTATARRQQTQRTRSKQSPKEPHAEAIPHPSMTRRLSPRGHTECNASSIELGRQSPKDASVSDGP
ncbi:hypothetical protein TcCL_NonESM02768 [Trypanosoma cruzi]|nr:hypothetical protein TcCL_NonESM02768 [Trypanosoma cruzi]